MDIDTSSKGKPLMPPIDDTDLACLIALQADPRASWRELGAASGIAERTVARRIKRLLDTEALRVIAETDPLAAGRGVVLHAWMRCRAGCIPDVAERLARLENCQLVVTLAGSADLMAELTLADEADMPDLVTRVLPSMAGVERVDARLVLRAFRRAGQWRIRAESYQAPDAMPAAPPAGLNDAEQRMAAWLKRDGRASLAELAEQCGVSEPTAQRMLQSLVERRALSFRVEVEPALVGFPVEAVVSVQVRPQAVNTLADHLARDPNTRCLFGTSGASQLFWHVLCQDSAQLWDVVTRRLGEREGVLNSDVAVVMRAHKRCGIVRADHPT
ncbi:Lrp/AsnC family transcriptional regulator [Bordetella avium]|uniref:Lrp/AsnC family transcriptional regulator n=1 Tax=Bordetella avium TaxID=521 RepID=UPI000E0B93E0|nr:Lrp/AsnC family transcriptional regulator [Bordetella avium]RIQ12332.1 AsnC family transcriptional regulator [Bordetella avium]RIQ36050.1 AsnC family transcriptional regulator [Bordetella avium]RIQ40122.1 AsnC family transcriptional regulator [Bordetella avium]RIQ41715.1 AsnC family transcriptional regulator [Bordetella avium]RIQ47439.1 AsnC family transcriptional regulator [Bordetella avium]